MNNSQENDEQPRYGKHIMKRDSPSLRKRDNMFKFESPYMDGRREPISMEWGHDMRPSPYYHQRRPRPDPRYTRPRDSYAHEPEYWPNGGPRRPERFGARPSDFQRRRPNPVERIKKWEIPASGNPPLQLEDEFKGVNVPVRNQLFRENNSGRPREMPEQDRQRNHLNMDLLERELETEMMEDRRRHMLEMDRRQYYMSPYGPSLEDTENLRPGRRRRMPWTENWDQVGRSNSRGRWAGESQRDEENSPPRLPSVAKYEEMLRERERLIQSQRQKDIEIENYRRQLHMRGVPERASARRSKMEKPQRNLRERISSRRESRGGRMESEREAVPGVKVLPRPRANSFLSSSQEKKSLEKQSGNPKNQNKPLGFQVVKVKEESPQPRVKISYTPMDLEINEQKSDSEPKQHFSRVEVKVSGDRVEVVQGEKRGRMQPAQKEIFDREDEPEEFVEDMLKPKIIGEEEKEGKEIESDKLSEKDQGKQASGEFRLKIAKKKGAIRITENQPQMISSLKNLNDIVKRSLSLEDIEPEEMLGNLKTKDKTTQTKDNPVIKFLGQHSLNKLSNLLKKQPEMNENQMLYISQKRGKGRPHKNKENAPFHCLLNKDKETIITEELDNIISSFVVCSLQDKQVSLKIKDFSFWMKNRLFEINSSPETFESQCLNLMDLTPDFLQSVSKKLLEKCFEHKFVSLLPDFRGVFMLDFLIFNTIKTRLITETVSLNFNTLNRLRNSQELTLPMVLASFVFLVSNFLISTKFEMFYAYSCYLFSSLFHHSISTCLLHLSGRSTQLEFSIQKLGVASQTAEDDIENAYQKFIDGDSPFNPSELKIFIESEKQLQFNSLLVHYIGIFSMLIE